MIASVCVYIVWNVPVKQNEVFAGIAFCEAFFVVLILYRMMFSFSPRQVYA